MNFYAKLIVALGLIAGIAAGLLSYTYAVTAPTIALRSVEEQAKALQNVFFLQSANENGKQVLALRPEPLGDGVTALYAPDNADVPAYYAVQGQAIGYNPSNPVTLMVGFTGEAQDAATLLKGYVPETALPKAGEKGVYVVGFSVISSEETPGLGERIKDSRPPFTWAQFLSGNRPPASPDKATAFQSQFRGKNAATLSLKKNGGDLDAITASTITSNAVIAAIRNAGAALEAALQKHGS